jgi:tetratricopeptide (TPR) repeat protein
MRSLILASFALLPTMVFAAGSNDASPPTPSPTTLVCETGLIWDEATQTCVGPESALLDDDQRYGAVRELAYAGQYDQALIVLATMSDQTESRVLTYYGFVHRKAGRTDLGMQYYTAALEADPDNILARSYMGQGFVAQGDIAAARVQLAEIQDRGGRETWSEVALLSAINTGQTYSY